MNPAPTYDLLGTLFGGRSRASLLNHMKKKNDKQEFSDEVLKASQEEDDWQGMKQAILSMQEEKRIQKNNSSQKQVCIISCCDRHSINLLMPNLR